MEPPVADRRPITTSHHGRDRVDDYEWMRAKDDPDVVAYLEAENAYTRERTAHLKDLRQTIFDEIKARTLETDLSVPTRNRGYWYYGRTFEGREYGASCRVPIGAEDDWDSPAARRGVSAPTSRRCPARSCCSTSTSSPRATTSSRSAARRSAPTPTCWPTRPTPPATSATPSGSRTCAPASCSTT